MTTTNLYDILLVEPDCTTIDIKNAYRKFAQMYHPDKKGGNAEMFDLGTHAYNVLINPKTRASFDKLYSVSKQSESLHIDLKSRSREYAKSLENTNKTKEVASIDFDKIFADMDAKYSLKRDNDKKIIDTTIDIAKKREDLESIREHDDIENIPEKIFDDGKFELEKFNTIFDNVHKKHTELIHHQGNPIAFNTLNEYGTFGSVDDYDTLYIEDDDLGSSMFGSVKMSDSNVPNKLNKKELDKLTKADYVKSHNYKDSSYNKSLEEKMEERDRETTRYKEREISDFNIDNNCGGYPIFKGIGLEYEDLDNLELLGDGDDLKLQYQQLKNMRK